MGKASSSKKVARAARAGGRVSSGQPRSLLFPGILTLVVVLGVALVVYARDDRLQQDLSGVPQRGDHIHAAFAVNVCGEFTADLPEFESPVGIHTHGDGVLHIHPFLASGFGANATLGLFFEDARDEGIEVGVSDDKVTVLGQTWEEGKDTCEEVEDPMVRMAWWEDVQDPESQPVITTGDFNSRRLDANGAGITIFFGDPDADIPKPPTAGNLAELGARDAAPSETSTTVEGETTTTTVAGDTTTTTAAP